MPGHLLRVLHCQVRCRRATVRYKFLTRHSEIPSNLVMKRISPKIWLPLLTAAWGIVAMCLGFVQNYAGLMVVRALLGATEGGLLPGIVSWLNNCGCAGRNLTSLKTGPLPLRHVYSRRNGPSDWPLLHQCFLVGCIRRFVTLSLPRSHC